MALSISRRVLRSFGSLSGFGRCGDSSSRTSQSFRASHGKGTCFTGISLRFFLLQIFSLSEFIVTDLYGHVSGDCLFSAESSSFIKVRTH